MIINVLIYNITYGLECKDYLAQNIACFKGTEWKQRSNVLFKKKPIIIRVIYKNMSFFLSQVISSVFLRYHSL